MKKIKGTQICFVLIGILVVFLIAGCSLFGLGTPGSGVVSLGKASDFVILAKSGVSNIPTSTITGDIGLSPQAESFLTGFSQTDATGYATAAEVIGKLYAADMAAPTPSNLTTAVSDMQTAYTDAATRTLPDFTDLGAGSIGGLTLIHGLYKWGSSLTIPTDVTISGSATDIWIFQISGNLTISSAKQVILSGGAQAKNIFWVVAGTATLDTTSKFKGIILCQTSITLNTGAVLNGRALAQTQVALDGSTVTAP